ncbi:hypothetical protein L21SP3_02316 [Sedimentisphaera cyanobacteriorum]|uniref:Uncharacterized protein n=1 Tax=Sedimentisphaera cyanobacteriorum TaxID=1940790 RepID=A0A1Q2HT32_9BACT|nr:hypothetical protein [Sedimentisphaera cyanobacteriorum]AQQ10483.1 hypothetical protein L21SP3_02316 [Sedimentisphaera cyanobacteriorum]
MKYFNPLKIINEDEGSDIWDVLIRQQASILTNKHYSWGLNLLKSGLKNLAKDIVVEPRYICKDYRDLFSNYYSKKFKVPSPYCERIHFFAENVNQVALILEPEEYQ